MASKEDLTMNQKEQGEGRPTKKRGKDNGS